jgi:hypothetical protein
VNGDEPAWTPPPLRYPLPTIVGVLILISLVWWGEAWLRRAVSALASPLKRVVAGPNYPHSDRPRIIAGPIVEKVLRLRDDVPVHSRPDGLPIGTFRTRGFADVYDHWPLQGAPTHYRIGNDKLTGWVAAVDVLPWATRLVLDIPVGSLDLRDSPDGRESSHEQTSSGVLPVVGWTKTAVQVALWAREAPWSRVGRIGWLRHESLPAKSWAVLLTDVEIVALRRAARRSDAPAAAARLRGQAALGTLLSDQPWTEADDTAARSALPPVLFANRSVDSGQPETLIAPSEAVASWGGFTFRAVPLSSLP